MSSVELQSKLAELQNEKAALVRQLVVTDAAISETTAAVKKAKRREFRAELAAEIKAMREAAGEVVVEVVKKKRKKMARSSSSSSDSSSSAAEEVVEQAAVGSSGGGGADYEGAEGEGAEDGVGEGDGGEVEGGDVGGAEGEVDRGQYEALSIAYDDAVMSLDEAQIKLHVKDLRINTLERDIQEYEDKQDALKREILHLKRKRRSSSSSSEMGGDSGTDSD